MATSGSKSVVFIAMACNFGIAVTKFFAAGWTGSSAMLSEAIHSLVDTSNQALLLFGLARAKRPPDARHPFGYSKEIYFWSFIVAILLFSMGAGVAIYEGLHKIHNPAPLTDAYILYAVLGIAILLEGFSTFKAVQEFNQRRGSQGILTALRSSKDPSLFVIVLEDIAALLGLVVAFAGIFYADYFGYLEADGYASIIIGLILGLVAAFLCIEIKGLIIGEAASGDVQAGIRHAFEAEIGTGKPLKAINEIRTMHLGPEDVLVAASVDFQDGETAASVEATTARLETALKAKYPEINAVFIEVQAAAHHVPVAKRAAETVRAATRSAKPA